jgi:acyl-CoA thioesterase
VTIDVPAGWRQGRGAYGGKVVSTLVRAIEARIADPARAIRSVTAEIPGAVQSGPAQIEIDILRAGNATTTARAALVQGGETRAHAVVIAGASRKAKLAWQEIAAPVMPAYDSLLPVQWTSASPEFAQHFDVRVVDGIPGAGGAARTLGWVRMLEPSGRDAGYVAEMIDAWWPAVLVRMGFQPMATIAFTLQIVGEVAEGPMIYRASVPVVSDGYFVEQRELWTADGQLVALNHQTFAII